MTRLLTLVLSLALMLSVFAQSASAHGQAVSSWYCLRTPISRIGGGVYNAYQYHYFYGGGSHIAYGYLPYSC